MENQAPTTTETTRASRKAPDTGIIVNLKLFVPYTRGDLQSMKTAVDKASALTTLDGLAKVAEGVEIIESVAREGTRPRE